MTFHCIVSHGMVLYLFDIIAVYCMSPHYILWYGLVLYFIWSYCTVSHCYVPLLQRAGELPRSAPSHFDILVWSPYDTLSAPILPPATQPTLFTRHKMELLKKKKVKDLKEKMLKIYTVQN